MTEFNFDLAAVQSRSTRGERLGRHEDIFDALQERLLESLDDVTSDAEHLADLAAAAASAAEALYYLDGESYS